MDNRVFFSECRTYDSTTVDNAVNRALEGLGGIESLGVAGKKVLIKTNLLGAFKPEKATTTHPEVIRAIASAFIAAGAEVTIADSPGGPYTPASLRHVYTVAGITSAAERSGAQLNYDTSSSKIRTGSGMALKELDVITPVQEADIIVSAAKLKTHGLAYYTGAVKNMYGVVPGLVKAAYHSRFPDSISFNNMIVDVCETVKPHLSIIDGVVGMEGPGPSAGTPKEVGVIAASFNPYALDLAMCSLVSLPYKMVPVLVTAIKKGLVPEALDRQDYLGDPVSRFKTRFTPAVSGRTLGLGSFAMKVLPKGLRKAIIDRRAPWPVMMPNCIGCGKCAEICPRQVIKIVNKLAVPDYSGCIRCYCCHEVCPVQAIELKKLRISSNG